MRQWSVGAQENEVTSPLFGDVGRKRPRVASGLHMRSSQHANSMSGLASFTTASFDGVAFPDHPPPMSRSSSFADAPFSAWAGDEERREGTGEDDAAPARLSRHIPQREGMDMSVSSFNLVNQPYSPPTLPTPSFSGTGGGAIPVSATSSSAWTSLTESQVSDDSTYMASLYNELLADKLSAHDPLGPDAEERRRGSDELGSGARHRRNLGGEVLRFTRAVGSTSCSDSRRDSSASVGSAGLLGGRHRLYSSVGRNPTPQRVLYTNPEKVLDAPEFPTTANQLLHWGSNDKLVIGLKNSVYSWDATSGESGKLVDLQSNYSVAGVHWLHKCSCVALNLVGGTVAVYDCRSEDFLRTLRVPEGLEVTRMAVNGPMLAVGCNSRAGCTQVFDLRAKSALVASYEGHQGGITALQYCYAEPYYLATGGEDGHVRVWDARRSSCPRYAFDHVHQGSVTALQWNPEKRSRLFSGGDDSILCAIDTHASQRALGDATAAATDEETATVVDIAAVVGGGVGRAGGLPAPYMLHAVRTQFPITGMICHGAEVLTSHRVRGQLQLRKANTLMLMGTFTAPNCEADVSCMTLAPDKERVCAAQADETLKFWRVFDAQASSPRSGHKRSISGGLTETPMSGNRSVGTGYQDPQSMLHDELR